MQAETIADRTLIAAIAACRHCSVACVQCADDCLNHPVQVQHLVRCIRLNLDCADVCTATARVIARQTAGDVNVARATLAACIAVCTSAGDENALHAEHGLEHCAVCRDECRDCAEACRSMLDAIGG